MGFPVDLSNVLPKEVGTVESRPFSIRRRDLRVVVSKVSETLYDLAVYETVKGQEHRRYGTDRPVIVEVLEFAWKNFHEDFPNIFE